MMRLNAKNYIVGKENKVEYNMLIGIGNKIKTYKVEIHKGDTE